MNIKYDNSLYSINAPENIIENPTNPEEEDMDWKIMLKKDEENYFINSFIDTEAERVRELIENGQNERIA